MTAPAIPSHPCADNPAYAICSPCCNVPRRCRQTLPRPAPASGPWCRVCPQGARTHLPGRAVWPISGDGSCRTCHAVYGMSMSDHDRSYDRGGTRCTCCRQGLHSRRSDTIRLSSIISIRSCKPFCFSVCLHISSENAVQAECRVKLASAMLRRSRHCRFHRNLFLCELHKVYSFFSFCFFLRSQI